MKKFVLCRTCRLANHANMSKSTWHSVDTYCTLVY